MKKFLVILLSLAVLFGFAACDNSSSTPDDGQTVETEGFSDTKIDSVATIIKSLLDGSFSGATAIDAIFTSEANLLDANTLEVADPDMTISDDYTEISKTMKFADGVDGFSYGTTVTLTLKGKDVTAAGVTGTKTIWLDEYTYTFSTNGTDTSENNVVLEGTISGAVVGNGKTGTNDTASVVVTIPASDATVIALKAPKYILLPQTADGIKVTLGGKEVDSAKLFAILNSGLKDIAEAPVAYNQYVVENQKDAMNKMHDYVEVLFTDNASGDEALFTQLVNFIADTDVNNLTLNEFNGGSQSSRAYAKISYTVPAGTPVEIEGTGKTVGISNIDITFYADAPAATVTSFAPTTFVISGTYNVYDTTTAKTAEPDFKTITLTSVTGTVENVTITGEGGKIKTLANGGSSYAKFALATKADISGTVDATVEKEVGPALTGTGSTTTLSELGAVKLDYAKSADYDAATAAAGRPAISFTTT